MDWFNSCSKCFLNIMFFLLVLLLSDWGLQRCEAFGTFGFDIHHRFSDPVKGILAVDELPEKGSVEYYVAMSHRDRLIKSRRLAELNNQTPVTFFDGNETYRLDSLGYLHYVNVSVGTPALWFLVALDTGSNLFWLPCDCISCVHGLQTSNGEIIDLNIYSGNTSSTSSKVLCNSSMCKQQRRCSSALSDCPYQVVYLSNGTSSTGILVEDVLHLTTDNEQSKVVDARITFGCGQVQTGSFLDSAAPNGLFGLGIDNISVPSILAKQGLASNSFSMCFGPDRIGRISFGDKGSSDQGETPFNLRQSHQTYNISISSIIVGGNVANLEFSAIFDSGTSFTYLNDPAYKLISESFNSLAIEKRHSSGSDLPFEYCYDISPNQSSFKYPAINLTMKGGNNFHVTDPIVLIALQGGSVYCLAVVKSEDVNIIGQNFMTGYRIVFDREKMVLGWKASDCYDIKDSTLPVNPPGSTAVPPTAVNPPGSTAARPTAVNPPRSTAVPPTAVNPEATVVTTPGVSRSPQLNPFTFALVIVLIPILSLF